MLKEHATKVWIVVLYQRTTGERIGHSQWYSKKGLAVNWAERHGKHYSRAEVIEYSLSQGIVVYSLEKG